MSATTRLALIESPQRRIGFTRRILRVLLGLTASLFAFLAAAIVLGAWFPAIPKAGIIGPVLAGQYPFHITVLALAGLILGVLARRTGLARWGRALIAITSVAAAFALIVGLTQFARAKAEHTQVSFGEIFTELAYPGVVANESPVYAERDGEQLQADVYLPDPSRNGPGPVPAIVLAHAGGFHTFDKSDLRGTGRWLADHGVAAIAVDYRLARDDRPTWDKAPQDLVTALRWTQDQAARLNIDTGRISLGGMSAGGTLAMNAAWRLQNGTIEVTDGRVPEPPHSVVGFYPGIDVIDMWQRDVTGSRRAAVRFTGGTPEQHPDRYRATSPLREVTTGLQPTLLVVGDRDRSATPESIDVLADALREHQVDTTVEKLPFAEHAFDDAYGSLTSQTSRQILLDFLT